MGLVSSKRSASSVWAAMEAGERHRPCRWTERSLAPPASAEVASPRRIECPPQSPARPAAAALAAGSVLSRIDIASWQVTVDAGRVLVRSASPEADA